MANLFDRTEYPEGIPDQLVAGDRWTWKRTDLTDYPVGTYALRYVFRLFGTGTTEIAIDCAEDGTSYYAEVAAATTAAYDAGWYSWQLYVIRSSDSERITLDSGRVEVLADRDEATSDPRNHNRKMLDILETAIESLASKTVTSYSIGDRSLTRMDLDMLRTQRDIYARRVRDDERAEKAERGKGGGNRVRVRLLND